MYNRYAPRGEFQNLEPEPENPAPSPLSLLQSLLGHEKNAGGGGILEKLGVSQLDRGDILLVLILIYLFRESGDDEWLIILALVLLMGLG